MILIRLLTGEETWEILLGLHCVLWVPCLENYDAVTPSVSFTTDDVENTYSTNRLPRLAFHS